jgi:hypothetical protein
MSAIFGIGDAFLVGLGLAPNAWIASLPAVLIWAPLM